MSASYIGSFLMGQQLTALQVALDAEKAKTATLETWASDRVKYAYPNGGSEGDEKALSLNSIYQTPSPFPAGVFFSTRTEFYKETISEWIDYERSFYDSNNGGGLGCLSSPRFSAALIAISTGDRSLGGASKDGGAWTADILTSVKWRVRCVRED